MLRCKKFKLQVNFEKRENILIKQHTDVQIIEIVKFSGKMFNNFMKR